MESKNRSTYNGHTVLLCACFWRACTVCGFEMGCKIYALMLLYALRLVAGTVYGGMLIESLDWGPAFAAWTMRTSQKLASVRLTAQIA